MPLSAIALKIFWWLYWAWVASELVIAITTRTKTSTGLTRDRGSQTILWIVIITCATLCFRIAYSHPPDIFPSDPHARHILRGIAVLVLILGLAIRWTAILSLGRAFSANVAIRESQQLRTIGLYRIVRHPSYLGLELVFLAIALASLNWLAAAIILIPTTGAVLYRIYVEEISLRAAFGQQYADYSAKTKRLIPGIY